MDYGDNRFARKNAELAKAYEKKQKTVVEAKVDGTASEVEATCYNCKVRNRCDMFRKWRTGGTAGAVSVTADQKFWCEKWIQDPVGKVDKVTPKQVKSMLRGVMKGRL